MKRIAVLYAAGLLVTSLPAQEQIYLYVSYHDAMGTSLRHKLDCQDSTCKLEMDNTEHSVHLTPQQKQQLLHALQAESRQFKVAMDPPLKAKRMKVKFRYDTPTKRLDIERRLPADQPVDLTPEMLQALKTHLALDLAQPLASPSASSETMDEPAAQGAGQ